LVRSDEDEITIAKEMKFPTFSSKELLIPVNFSEIHPFLPIDQRRFKLQAEEFPGAAG
jgi:hypothetical protein